MDNLAIVRVIDPTTGETVQQLIVGGTVIEERAISLIPDGEKMLPNGEDTNLVDYGPCIFCNGGRYIGSLGAGFGECDNCGAC